MLKIRKTVNQDCFLRINAKHPRREENPNLFDKLSEYYFISFFKINYIYFFDINLILSSFTYLSKTTKLSPSPVDEGAKIASIPIW